MASFSREDDAIFLMSAGLRKNFFASILNLSEISKSQ